MDNIFGSWKHDKQAHVRYISPRIDIYVDTFPLISKLFRKVIDLY